MRCHFPLSTLPSDGNYVIWLSVWASCYRETIKVWVIIIFAISTKIRLEGLHEKYGFTTLFGLGSLCDLLYEGILYQYITTFYYYITIVIYHYTILIY